MKTHFILAQNNYRKYYPPVYSQDVKANNCPQDKFCVASKNVSFGNKLTIADSLIKKFNLNPILHFKEFTLDEYSKLSPVQISKLRAKFDEIVKHSLWTDMDKFEKIHAIVADAMQDAFDRFFGKDNYVVVTIGRSLSSIGKALGYRIGEKNVVNVPLSSAGRFVPESVSLDDHQMIEKLIRNDEGLEKFLKYLKSVGLSKEDVEKSGKKYILTDYCFLGRSLIGSEFLFKSDMVWGAKNKNIYSADVMRILDNYTIGDPIANLLDKTSNKNNVDYYQIIKHALWQQRLKYSSFVGKSSKLGDALKASKSYKSERKIFNDTREVLWFKILDNAINSKKTKVKEVTPKTVDNVITTTGQVIPPWEDLKSIVLKNIRADVQRANQIASKSLTQGSQSENIAHDMAILVNNIEKVYSEYPERYLLCRGDILKAIERAEKELS